MVDLADMQLARRVTVHAAPDALYALVADVTRIGELSPVCRAAWWDEGAGPHEGAWFTGRNEVEGRDPWERRCEVAVVEPGLAFGWVAGGRAEGTAEWTYRFRAVDGGTEVEESWRLLQLNERLQALSDEQLHGFKQMTASGMETTLANLKALAEG
jgi:hypothetical protein